MGVATRVGQHNGIGKEATEKRDRGDSYVIGGTNLKNAAVASWTTVFTVEGSDPNHVNIISTVAENYLMWLFREEVTL